MEFSFIETSNVREKSIGYQVASELFHKFSGIFSASFEIFGHV